MSMTPQQRALLQLAFVRDLPTLMPHFDDRLLRFKVLPPLVKVRGTSSRACRSRARLWRELKDKKVHHAVPWTHFEYINPLAVSRS